MTQLRLPAFIIGGAPRSGTTWLAKTLDRHPDIWLAKPLRPEPKFFLVDDLYAEGLDTYASRWFAHAPRDAVVGEKSTNYLESPRAAARIAEALPGVRLIFVLREPADRAFSNYRWSVMNGLEDRPFDEALKLEEQREGSLPPVLRYARPHAYFSRGCYADLLQPYVERFPAEQILCLRFEDLRDAPGIPIGKVHSFLGVQARPPDGGLKPINASSGDAAAPSAVMDQLRSEYREPNRRLAQLLGPEFPGWD